MYIVKYNIFIIFPSSISQKLDTVCNMFGTPEARSVLTCNPSDNMSASVHCL